MTVLAPRRIQRRRTKGWRMPECAVYVGRPTKWGNPWVIGDPVGTEIDRAIGGCAVLNAEICVELYRQALLGPSHPNVICGLYGFSEDDAREQLAGRDLVCWCPLDRPCHADVLLEVANG